MRTSTLYRGSQTREERNQERNKEKRERLECLNNSQSFCVTLMAENSGRHMQGAECGICSKVAYKNINRPNF